MSRIRRGDVLILALILALAGVLFLLSFLPEGEGKTLEVTVGKEIKTYSLAEDATFSVKSGEYTLHIVIKDKTVSVVSADCPDKVCQNHGVIEHAGQTVICVPSQIVLRIKGGDESEDAVAG